MTTNKHIKNYSQFIFEQDMGMPAMPGMPGEAPTQAKKEKKFPFIFLDGFSKSSKGVKKYPDGSYEYSFPTYSVTKKEIEDWVKKNIVDVGEKNPNEPELEVRRNNIINIVLGDKVNISKEDVSFVEKLKNAVSTDIFGSREPETSVFFTKDGSPSTEQIDVTFIKYDK